MIIDYLSNLFSEQKEKVKAISLPFQTSTDIEAPNQLFGRDDDLQYLCGYAEGLQQVEIIGVRRFGKTCLAKTFVALEKKNNNRRVYPVYVDLYSDGIIGTANVWRYLSSKIVSNLYYDGYISNKKITIDGYKIKPLRKWEKVYKQLSLLNNSDARCLFDEIIEKYSKQLRQTILLLFDEYEKCTEAFDNINGLMHLRKLSNDTPKYVSFWIIGATPWRIFVVDKPDYDGSGAFNGVTQNRYVCPLNKDDFKEMWEYECDLITDEIKRQELKDMCEKVFVSSGGIPCFAKEIGAYCLIEGEYPKYNRLNNHFVEIKKKLSNEELKYLRVLLSSPQKYAPTEVPNSIDVLETYGLIKKDEQERYFIPCRFFADFIRAELFEKQLSTTDNIDYITYVEKISDIIRRINDLWFNKYNIYMFDITNATQGYYQTLPKPCDNPDKFSVFINAMYCLYWEGAKENDIAGEKIPEYFKKTIFRLSMDRIRHVFGKAHEKYKLTTRYGQVDITTALSEITGYSTEPETPEEWLSFQECMLKRFLKELSDIHKSIIPEIVNGGRYSGVIVEVSKQNGRKYKNIKSEISYRMLRIKNSNLQELHDGDCVSFTAKQESDPNNPLMSFWIAYDVELE